jgi:hypothetical protein
LENPEVVSVTKALGSLQATAEKVGEFVLDLESVLDRQRTAALETVAKERKVVLDAITDERTEALRSVTEERIASIESVRLERIAALQEVNTIVDDAVHDIFTRVDARTGSFLPWVVLGAAIPCLLFAILIWAVARRRTIPVEILREVRDPPSSPRPHEAP